MTTDTPTFYLLRRGKGRKLFAIAGTDSGNCIAGAESCFSMHGFSETYGNVTTARSVERQKNFAGRSPEFRQVDSAERELRLHWFRDYRKRWPDESPDELCVTFPDARQFFDSGELS